MSGSRHASRDKMGSVALERKFGKELVEKAVRVQGSKYALAMELGYYSKGSGKTINDWMEGKAKIPYSMLEKICEIAGVPLEEVLRHVYRTHDSRHAHESIGHACGY